MKKEGVKLSDYVMQYLEARGVKDIFLLSGGGMMHLLDSVGKSNINYYCNLHEQASAICADAYAQATNELAVCMFTTGPGATNAITGVANSWLDSLPVLVLSGQVKRADLVGDKKVRQIGAQEIDIVKMTQSIVKYGAVVMEPNEIKYHLDKAIYLATSGRRGPVWLDIPLDVQAAIIEPETLKGYEPDTIDETELNPDAIERVFTLLKEAKAPAFLIGYGVYASGVSESFRHLAELLQIPVLSTWRAKMVMEETDPLHFGHPGTPGPRYANYILQNTDCLIIIGSRLNVALTAFNEANFAPKAKKVMVDIDPHEIEKMKMPLELSFQADAKVFVEKMLEKLEGSLLLDYDAWLRYCRAVKARFPIYEEQQHNPESTNLYLLMNKLSKLTRIDDVIVEASSGRSCGILGMAYERKDGQVQIGAMGMGSMGFALPAAIGACVACDKRRTVTLEGDGSLQHNLQELALINAYQLPIKLFVLNNGGYASIMVMQNNHFKGRFVACNEETGVSLPPVKKIAELYDLRYLSITSNDQVDSVLAEVMKDDAPVVCEILADYTFDEIPKAMSKVNPDGSMVSSSLDNLFPFLPEDEQSKWVCFDEGAWQCSVSY